MPADLSAEQAALLAVVGAALGLLGLVVALLALRSLRRVRRATERLTGGAGDLTGVLQRQAAATEAVRQRVDVLEAGLQATRADVTRAVRHVAVVRYDAFSDMGGRMSFSAALVDDHGDGVVLTSINGRSETRTYAKGLVGGQSEQPLSPEEVEVVAHARAAAPPSGSAGRAAGAGRSAARGPAGRRRVART